MPYSLEIHGLKVQATIGVHPWEQRIKQTLQINFTTKLKSQNFANNLENTIDYAALCNAIADFFTTRAFGLIETAAEELCAYLKQQFKLTASVLTIYKPFAVKAAERVGVTISS